jgi:glycerophosphoryl diester phosphodiesterase
VIDVRPANAASAWASSPLVVGHRGGRGEGWPPENTLASFAQARTQGARAIELDVRTCSGGGVVVFHDDTLARMTHGRDSRRVSDVPKEELVGIDLGGGAAIPSLRAVLAWARREGVAVNVEMKHDVPRRRSLARDTVATVAASGADVLLSSFDPLLLALAAAYAPSAARALLTQTRQPRWASALQEVVRPPVVAALHIERTQARSDAIARYRARGLRVGVWTVNDPAEARELASLGAASIITDHPGEMLRALAGR